MNRQKFTLRGEYRQQESQRSKESVSLSEKYLELKSLTVEFAHFSSDGLRRNSEIKYTVNPAHAKSVFRLDCLNTECVRGDYDLSETLAKAIAMRQTLVTGEMCCQGWLSKTTIGELRCQNLLRFKLSLEYSPGSQAGIIPLHAA